MNSIIDGKFGKALSFDAVDDYVSFGNVNKITEGPGNYDLTVMSPEYETITRSVYVAEEGRNDVDFSLII